MPVNWAKIIIVSNSVVLLNLNTLILKENFRCIWTTWFMKIVSKLCWKDTKRKSIYFAFFLSYSCNIPSIIMLNMREDYNLKDRIQDVTFCLKPLIFKPVIKRTFYNQNSQVLTWINKQHLVGQEATVRNRHGTTDWLQIGKGVCQGCICHPAYLTYMQSTSCEMPGWMKHKLE